MNTLKQEQTRWRNLGIIAHVDAGKTTLTERLLWTTGAIHRMGEVHDGLATTDFSPIERQRGITIGAAAVQASWSARGDDAQHRLTLIDTPGHVDFAIEVGRVAYQETPRAAVRSVEGAVRKQGGGPGQFARVVIELLPHDDGQFLFTDSSSGGVVPRQYIAATEKGARAALNEGPRGWPVVGLEVRLLDGEFHVVDSSDLAFQRAGAEALRGGFARSLGASRHAAAGAGDGAGYRYAVRACGRCDRRSAATAGSGAGGR